MSADLDQAPERLLAGPALIVAGDTVVDLDGAPMGKPRDAADARDMLAKLAGRDHLVHSAFCLRTLDGRTLEHTETTKVRFYPLTADEIEAYVESGDGSDKAGAYGIQGIGAPLVERIDGDFYTVVGFPLGAFVRSLPKVGWSLRPHAVAGVA